MSLVVRDATGYATHRIEVAANGVDLIMINTRTNMVDQRIENAALDPTYGF